MGRLKLLRRGLISFDKAGSVLVEGEVGLDICHSLSTQSHETRVCNIGIGVWVFGYRELLYGLGNDRVI
jgi:hypothetical protein